jgi:uncharacterized protein (TIGR03435 family)
MAMMLAIPLCGQTFDVASIRHNLSRDQRDAGINILPGGRISGTNLPLRTLIWQAYNTTDFRLTGGPAWLDKDRYDIAAKTANGENITFEQLPSLLQHLLADRFQLKTHWETRETTVYSLVVDKGGPKLKEDADGPNQLRNSAFNKRQPAGPAHIAALRTDMGRLAVSLTNVLGRIVEDKTGLTGTYDFTLDWELDPGAPDATGASMFSALKEQLGLRLDAHKGQVEMLVIDNAEQPSEN